MAEKTRPPQRAQDRRNKVASASAVAGKLLSGAMRQRGFAQAEIVMRWNQIVGPELASSTVPVNLQFPRGKRLGATLIVRCESAFAPLLSHRAPRVIEMVNGFFGYGAVAKLEIKQGPLPHKNIRMPLVKQPLAAAQKQKLDALTGNGELSPLRQAIKSLGEYVLAPTAEGRAKK